MANRELRPNFFIAGAPHCGIAALHGYLRQHPECFMPQEMTEPGFFGPDVRVNAGRRADSERKYLAMFRNGAGKRRIGDSSAWYMFSKVAAKRIAEWDGRSQAILMIRNPVDAAYALHGKLLAGGEEHLEDFEEAMGAEAERREGKTDALQYTEVFSYAPQIERFYDALGRARVKVIVFDDFVLNTGQVYRDTLQFLGLDVEFEADFSGVSPVKRRISGEVRERLIPKFKDDVERTSELVDRDLTYWCKTE
jgi:hypothetical protein